MEKITPSSKIQRNPGMVSSTIDEEIVMMSIENGEYYGLDEIGSRIWTLIEKPIIVKNLIQSLLEEFDVDEKECIEDTLAFLNDLSAKNLVSIL